MYNFIIKYKSLFKDFVKKIISNKTEKKINPLKVYLFFVFVLSVFVLTTQFVKADSISDLVSGIMQGFAWLLLALAQFCIALTVFFLRFFITLASYNDFIDTSVVKIGWYMVRDVANMFFIVALLVIAFATILGVEKYEWKKSMVKLVIMAILINFSNMIAQLIIDVAHIFTVTFLNAISATAGGNLISMFSLDRVTEMVSKKDLGWTNEMQMQTQIFAGAAAAFIFAGLAAVAIGSYCIIMIYRVVILWVLIILSPLAYLFAAMPATEKYAQEWWKEFINYVTVAPIMVFFLWLAFASLGTGDILSQIEGAKGGGVIMLTPTGEPQSASLADVTEWTKMANFLIAIVFLMVGLRKVKETGVEGSNAIDKAMDFGKKAATIATGYAAGRWMVDKGMSGAKSLGIMTGNKILAKTGVAEIGAELLNKYRIGRDQFKEKRAQDAKQWEKNYADKGGVGNWFKAKMLGQVWQPEERSQKVRSDWKRASELANETMMDNLGTSSTRAGNAKQRQGSRLADQKALGEAKKVEKELKLFLKLQEEFDGTAGQSHEEFLDAKAKLAAVEKTGTDDEKKQAKEEYDRSKEKYEQSLKNVSLEARETFADGEMGGKRDTAYKTKASVEIMKKDQDRLKEVAIARRRDEEQIKNNKIPKYLDQTLNRHRKEDEEELSGLNFRQITRLTANSAKELAEKTKKNGGVVDKDSSYKTATALISSLNRDSETGMRSFDDAATAVGFDEEINNGDRMGQQRKMLSILLGKKIEGGPDEKNNIRDAFKELNKVHGEEDFGYLMKDLDAAIKVTANDGGTRLAGLLNDEEVDEKTNKIKFAMQEDEEKFTKERNYRAEEANVTKITGTDDIINTANIAGGNKVGSIYKVDVKGNKTNDVDKHAMKQMLTVLSSFKSNSRFTARSITSLRNMYENSTVSGWNELMKELEKTAGEAAKAIKNQIEIKQTPPAQTNTPATPATPNTPNNPQVNPNW